MRDARDFDKAGSERIQNIQLIRGGDMNLFKVGAFLVYVVEHLENNTKIPSRIYKKKARKRPTRTPLDPPLQLILYIFDTQY